MPRIVRPDLGRLGDRNLGPPLDEQLVHPLSETKNWRKSLPSTVAVKKIQRGRSAKTLATMQLRRRESARQRWPNLFPYRELVFIGRAIWIGNAQPGCSMATGARVKRTSLDWHFWPPLTPRCQSS